MRYEKPSKPAQLPELRAQLVDDEWLWEMIDLLGFFHSDLAHPQAIHDSLRDANLWWVGSDCCDLLEQAAPSMPPVHLTTATVPDVDGFVCFERPLSGSHGQLPGVEVSFDFIQWQPTIIQGLASVSIIPWRLLADDGSTPPSPLGRSDWPFGFTTDQRCDGVSDLEHQSIVEDRRLLAALWQLSAQPGTTETSEVTADRAARRRLARSGHQPAPVRLVNLRHTRTRAPTSAGIGTREYSCRWPVKVHWRQQAYGPGRSLRKAIFIDRQIRGPADKPLRVRDAVKVWET